ncbi:MAG: hypothetical protein AAFN77_24045 [Planctomycetota bacterium]
MENGNWLGLPNCVGLAGIFKVLVLLLLVLTFSLVASAQETDLIDDMMQDVVRPDGVQNGNKFSLVDFDPNSFRELILSPFDDWHLVDVTFRQEMNGFIEANEAKVLVSEQPRSGAPHFYSHEVAT